MPTTSRRLLQVPQPHQAPPDPSRATFTPATGPLHLLLPEQKAASSASFISMHAAPPHTEHCAAALHGPCAVSSKGTSLFLGGVRSPGPREVCLRVHQNLLEGRQEGRKEGGRGEESGKKRGFCEDGSGVLSPAALGRAKGVGTALQGGPLWGQGLPGGPNLPLSRLLQHRPRPSRPRLV